MKCTITAMVAVLVLLAGCSPSEDELSSEELAAELERQVEAGEGLEVSIECPGPMPPEEWHEVRCTATGSDGEFTVVAVASSVRDGRASVGYSLDQ